MRYYNLHGLVRCAAADGPGAEEFHRWMEPFASEPVPEEQLDLVWFPAPERIPEDAVSLRGIGRETAGPHSAVRRTGWGAWECHGAGHNFRAIFQDVLLQRGASLCHGAAVQLGETGMLLWGASGTGKTAVVLAAYREPDLRIVADETAILAGDGRVLSFPDHMALKPRHLALLPAAVRERLSPRVRPGPIAGLARVEVVRRSGLWVKGRMRSLGGPARRMAGRMQPEYVEVPLRELFGSDRLAAETRLDRSVFLVPGGSEVEEMSADDARSELLAVTYRELDVEDSLYDYALSGVLDLPGHWERAVRVNTEALQATPRLLRVPVPAMEDAGVVQARLLELLRGLA